MAVTKYDTEQMKQLGKRLCDAGSAMLDLEEYGDTGDRLCVLGEHLYQSAKESERQRADIANDTIARAFVEAKPAVEALIKAKLTQRAKLVVGILSRWWHEQTGQDLTLAASKPATVADEFNRRCETALQQTELQESTQDGERARAAVTCDLRQDAEDLLSLAEECRQRVTCIEFYDEQLAESKQCLQARVLPILEEILAHYRGCV